MKRSYWLIAAVLGVVILAVGLRARSHFTRGRPAATAPVSPTSLPGPWDYVAHPWVAPDETDRGPDRIVSLAPSITEIVCALGLSDRLVGRTQYSEYLADKLESVTVVGGALDDTNLGKIRSLEPDLVLVTWNSGESIDDLRALGLRCETVPHESLEDVYEAIERLGVLCDRPKTARALAAAIRTDIESLQAAAGSLKATPQKVLVTYDPLPVPPGAVWVAGPGSFLDALLRLSGHSNAAVAVNTSSDIHLPLEKLLTLDVDVILTFGEELSDDQRSDLYASWSSLASLRAIGEQRVRRAGGKEWLSAGPRVALALHDFLTVLSEFR